MIESTQCVEDWRQSHATANQNCVSEGSSEVSGHTLIILYQIPTFQKPNDSHLTQQISEVFTSSWSQGMMEKSVDLGGSTNFKPGELLDHGHILSMANPFTIIHTSPCDRFNLMVRSSFDTLEIFGICKCSEYVVIKRCEKPMFAYSHVLADQDGSSYELQCCRKTVCCPLRSHSPASSFSGSYIQT